MKEIEKFNEIIETISTQLEMDIDDEKKKHIIMEILYLILRDKEFSHLIHKGN